MNGENEKDYLQIRKMFGITSLSLWRKSENFVNA